MSSDEIGFLFCKLLSRKLFVKQVFIKWAATAKTWKNMLTCTGHPQFVARSRSCESFVNRNNSQAGNAAPDGWRYLQPPSNQQILNTTLSDVQPIHKSGVHKLGTCIYIVLLIGKFIFHFKNQFRGPNDWWFTIFCTFQYFIYIYISNLIIL